MIDHNPVLDCIQKLTQLLIEVSKENKELEERIKSLELEISRMNTTSYFFQMYKKVFFI